MSHPQDVYDRTDASILLALTGPPGAEEEEMADIDAETKLARRRLRTVLLILVAAGIFFNFLSHQEWTWLGWTFLEPIAREFGSALIVAAVIGGTVDLFFKDEFARDAFVAAFRYVLPIEFRDEVDKIIRHEFIADKQVWSVKIEKTDKEGIVLITTTFERHFKNKTKNKQRVKAWYEVEDHCYLNGPTKILECGIQGDSEGSEGYANFTEATKDHYVEAYTSEISLLPGDSARVWGKAVQYRRTNDSIYETFRMPIANPEIDVSVDDNEFEHVIAFGTSGKWTKSKLENHYTLSGVYFPGQYMFVRWWPKQEPRLNLSRPELRGTAAADPAR